MKAQRLYFNKLSFVNQEIWCVRALMACWVNIWNPNS